MKFTPGPLGADLSGSIGAVTASRNRFGPYFRTKAIPINPNTVRQQTIRALFATLVNNWTNTLSAADRIAWEVWAENTTILGKDGSPINITGQNAYVRFNTIRLQIGETRVDAAPIIFNNGSPVTGFEATDDAQDGVFELNIAGDAVATTARVIGETSALGNLAVYLGTPVNATRTFFKGPYQLAASILFPPAASAIPITTLLIDLLNAILPVEDQFRSIRLRNVYEDGRLSEKFEALALVTLAAI